jgi:predicted RNA binding protein YcfA (HicA-like mRNA interferase family)
MIAALLQGGFVQERVSGDHVVLYKDGLARPVIVPLRKELPEFVVSNNLRTAGISRKDYLVLLGRRKPR